MHFILFYEVVDNFVEKRQPFRQAHLKNVQQAFDRGDLVLAGALADPPDRAVLVFNGPKQDAAERFAETDPYVTNGLVKTWKVRKWMTVVGAGSTRPSIPDATGHS